MAIDNLPIGNAIAYGIFISILLLFYLLYSRMLLNHMPHQFEIFDDMNKVHFFILVIVFTLSGYFFGPLDSSEALLISIIIPTGQSFGLYSYAKSHPEGPTISKLNITILWGLHVIPLSLIFFYHNKIFFSILTLVEVNL